MKLLFVHDCFGALAGAEANIIITATELKGLGHTVAILHGPCTHKNEDSWRAVFTERFPLDEEDGAARTLAALKAFEPDVVYVHKMADLEVLGALIQSRLPLVRMVHDHDMYCMRSYKYNYVTRRICTRPASLFCVFPCGGIVTRNRDGGFPVKFSSYTKKKKEIALSQQFDRLLVVTTYMRDELLRNGFDPSKIEILAPAPRSGDPGIRSSFSERNLIVFAGQIVRGKGIDVLLESLLHVKTPFECVILGQGSHKPYCEKLCRKLGLQDRVRFAGFIPQEELTGYYREATVMAISSVWPEPYATTGVEVMRYAIPVVAFDAGGIKDWLIDGYNGYLVPWMDKKTFAAKLDALLKDKHLAREMGERGQRLVNEMYNFPRYIADLEKLFSSLRGSRHRPALAQA